MFAWIWKRTLRLFLVGSVFALGIVCIYYYSLVIESVSPRSVKVPLGVGLEAAPGRLFRHTLYHTALNKTSFLKHNLSKVQLAKLEVEKNLRSPKLLYKVQKRRELEQSPKPRPELKLDRYSEFPVLSSSVLDMIDGSEYMDERVVEVSLTCKGVIFRDRQHVYGRCRNFTNMRFIDGSRLVAMPSFPGSGSTWARSALEQASGIYTGSIYCDNGLKSKGFIGEKVISANVLVVKTHYPSQDLFIPLSEFHDPSKFKNITAAILLVRNPLDSIVSLWNWMHGGHTATTSPRAFGNYSKWRKFVDRNAKEFSKLVHYWLGQANISSILVIKYEDMLTDLATQLRKMLDFLKVPYSDKDIECVVRDELESYHRKKGEHFDHYIPADRQIVLDNLMSVETLLNKYNVSYKDVLTRFQNQTIATV